MDYGDERKSDAPFQGNTSGETVFEADTAELKAVSASPASTGDMETSASSDAQASTAGDTEGESAMPAPDDAEKAPTGPENASPLAPGEYLGKYRVERTLHASADEVIYLARGASPREAESSTEDEAPTPAAAVLLIARPAGNFAATTGIVTLRLHHPRLLAPLELIERGRFEYLVLEALAGPDGTLAETVAQGARLDPSVALAAGAGLADALSYLHRNGVAHLHVSPDVLVVSGGRVYLSGMESAERVAQGAGDLSALFARDANFLARSLGILAGIPDEPDPHEDMMVDVLRQIVAYGAANTFTNVDDVAATCAAALQTTPSLTLSGEAATGRLTLLSASATTVGRVRSENQDASARVTFDIHDDVSGDMPLHVFLVADGMGGEAHGEIASRIAARVVPAEMARSFAIAELMRPVEAAVGAESSVRIYNAENPSLGTALARAVSEANQRVRDLAELLGQTTGTTLTAIATRGSQVALAHLGDSRAYLLRGETMAQLTEDHSVLARLQAIDHPLLSDPDVFVPRNMLYRSLGQEDDTNPDTLDFTLADGDKLVLCSDGLWDELDDYTIAETLAAATDPAACAERLVTLANASGGHDNSTAVVIFARATVMLDGGAGDDGTASATESEMSRETAAQEEP